MKAKAMIVIALAVLGCGLPSPRGVDYYPSGQGGRHTGFADAAAICRKELAESSAWPWRYRAVLDGCMASYGWLRHQR